MQIIESFLSFFVPLFIVLLHYWYISIPLLAAIIWIYIKAENETLRKILRIILSFIILSVGCALVYYLMY